MQTPGHCQRIQLPFHHLHAGSQQQGWARAYSAASHLLGALECASPLAALQEGAGAAAPARVPSISQTTAGWQPPGSVVREEHGAAASLLVRG